MTRYPPDQKHALPCEFEPDSLAAPGRKAPAVCHRSLVRMSACAAWVILYMPDCGTISLPGYASRGYKSIATTRPTGRHCQVEPIRTRSWWERSRMLYSIIPKSG